MKNGMKNLLTIIFFITMVSGTVNAANVQNNKAVKGEWKFEVTSAPYGYEKGVLSISEKKGILTGEIKFEDNYKIKLKKLIFADGVFTCCLYVDYDYISVKVKVVEEKMTGTVTATDEEMRLTAEKVK